MEQKADTKQQLMMKIKIYKHHDLEKQKLLSFDLLELATKENDTYALAFAHTYLADFYLLRRQHESCFEHMQESFNICKEYHYRDQLLLLHNLLGIYHSANFDEISAVQAYVDALALAEDLDNMKEQMVILNNIAILFSDKNDVSEAIRYLNRAYAIFLNKKENITKHIELVVILNLIKLYVKNDQSNEAYRIYHTYILDYRKHCSKADLYIIYLCELHLAFAEERLKEVCHLTDIFINSNLHTDLNRAMYFNFYNDVFHVMLQVKDKDRAEQLLRILGTMCLDHDIEQQLKLHLSWINFAKTFNLESTLLNSYKQYYLLQKMVSDITNKTKSASMREKILINHLRVEKDAIIQEKKNLEAKMKIDGLTQIFNRSYFVNLVDKMRKNASVTSIGIVIVDVDYFKEYNDFYGHFQGDVLLKSIAQCLDEHGDSRVFTARFGGDEFIILCVNMNEQEIDMYLRQVYNDLASRQMEHEKSIVSHVATISSGYVLFKNDLDFDYDVCVTLADTALYSAKVNGRNRFEKYDL